MELRVILKKEVANEAEAKALWEQLKKLIAPAEPIEKDARVIDNHELE